MLIHITHIEFPFSYAKHICNMHLYVRMYVHIETVTFHNFTVCSAFLTSQCSIKSCRMDVERMSLMLMDPALLEHCAFILTHTVLYVQYIQICTYVHIIETVTFHSFTVCSAFLISKCSIESCRMDSVCYRTYYFVNRFSIVGALCMICT